MPHPSDTTEIAERFGPPLPPGDTAIEPPASISGDQQRTLRKCTSLAEWLELGETRSPNAGGTSARISLHMLRSAHLPVGYGFEFDRLLRRVSMRHSSGVVIHSQPLLVSCDDAFDGELRYHYCSFEVFSRLINSQQFDSPIWRHQRTTKKEPSAFDGLEEIARVLGISQRQHLQYCIPLRQAPPLGVDHHSEPSQSDADVEPRGAQTASDEEALGAGHVAIPLQFPEQEGLTAPFFETETSADERSEGSRSQRSQHSQRRRSQEQKELLEILHRQRKATGAKETATLKELPPVAKEFLLSTMLEWRHITATDEMKDIGWVIPSRHSLRVWAKIPSGGEWLKFAFQSQASGVSVTRSGGRWTLISKDETVRSEASEASECWFEFRRHNASSELRVGHGLSTESPPVARVATKVLREMKVCLQSDQRADVELGHDALIEPSVASQDLSKLASAVDLKDASGTPVLTHAVRGGNLAVVAALLKAKANVHARDAKFCTALHYSAHDGNAEAAKVLLQAGASAFARNCSGATPRDVALLRWTPRVQSDGFESEDRHIRWLEKSRLILEISGCSRSFQL